MLEAYRTGFWVENEFDGATILFTTHAVVQTWSENFTTRIWLHPDFDPYDLDAQRGLAHSFTIQEVVFDELEVDEFLDVLPDRLFRQIKGAQKTYGKWREMKRIDRRRVYSGTRRLTEVDSFEHFDRLMKLNLSTFDEVAVDFDGTRFGHGETGNNVYQRKDGDSYHVGIL